MTVISKFPMGIYYQDDLATPATDEARALLDMEFIARVEAAQSEAAEEMATPTPATLVPYPLPMARTVDRRPWWRRLFRRGNTSARLEAG